MKAVNQRRIFFVLAVVVLMVLIFLLLQKGQRQKSEKWPQLADLAAEIPPANQADSTNQSRVRGAGAQQSPAERSAPSSTSAKRRLQQLARAPDYMIVPINFYGLVIDQDSHPLAGVHVVVSVRQWEYVSERGLNTRIPKRSCEPMLRGGLS
jgi:hypothetical protein